MCGSTFSDPVQKGETVPENRAIIVCLVVVSVLLVACGGGPTPTPAPTEPPPEPVVEPTTAPTEPPEEGEPAVPTEEPTALPEPTLELFDAEPTRVEFEADDGTMLVGTFWAPAEPSAPGVLLMHWARGDRTDWYPIATLLQGRAIAEYASAMQAPPGYAVFAFDFRGYGESGGEQDWPSNVADAREALEVFRSQPGVDPDAIFMVGASIGSDAAVDACGEGCIGAVSLSPGGFLGIPYLEALVALGGKPVLCVAAEGDSPSHSACRSGEELGLGDYRVHIYTGSAHGMQMFDITDQTPALTDLLFAWLAEHTP
jgi:dienelactone hydrolase